MAQLLFKIFHSWFSFLELDKVVRSLWENDGVIEDNVIVCLKKKSQALKNCLKQWSKECRSERQVKNVEFKTLLADLDKKKD